MPKSYKVIIATLVFNLFFLTLQAQEKFTINGYISDANSGETLIGATVFINELGDGAVSNEYGFYAINLEPGEYTLVYSYLGYDDIIKKLTLDQDVKLDVEMGSNVEELDEVLITSEVEDQNVTDNQMSVNKLNINTISKIPSLLGEVEIIRSIQLLPGVSTVGEGATGFNVRGGSIDQNLVLLDEAPVYNSSHLFGFFSVFNPDAVKDVQLYKGGIPARYGGRLSSILDVRMREGNNKKLSFNGGVGTVFSRLAVEGPLVKDKASFIVAGRRSYVDVLAAPFLEGDTKLNFYDLTIKSNYKFSEKDQLFLSGYIGRDNFGFGDAAGFNWGNTTLSLRWNHLFNERLFANVTTFFSDYDYQINFGEDSTNSFDWNAAIKNYSIKPSFTYFISPTSTLRFGGQAIVYDFLPGRAIGISESEVTDVSLADRFALEGALYIDHEVDVNDRFSLIYGLRYSHFNYTGEGNAYEFADAPPGVRREVVDVQFFDQWESIQKYGNLEPRLSLKYLLNESSSVKASYNRTAQYIHLISNTTASTPVDTWTPSTNNIRPQVSDQIALGYFKNIKDNTYELSTEVYYKKLNHLVDYIDNADLILNEFLEGDLISGEGRAYGLEFLFKKEKGDFTGWLSYTLARTERRVPGINGGEWYPSRFDQTHNLSITGFYTLNDRWEFSGNFALISGTPTTFATTRFEQQGLVIPHNAFNSRNNVRIPTYHRADISATLYGKKNSERRWQSHWVFSVYNLYSRRNAFSIFFRKSDRITRPDEAIPTEAVRFSVIGSFIPAVSYNFKF